MHSRPWKISAPSRLTPEKLESGYLLSKFTQNVLTLNWGASQESHCTYLSVVGLCVCFLRCLFDCSHVFLQGNRHPVRCSSQVQLLDESLRIK